jgi:hypothetical protein
MVNFLVTVGVVCVLPFVIAILESGIREYVHARAMTSQFAGGGRGGGVGLTRAFDLRDYEFTPVIYPPSLPRRWSRQHLLSAPTEGSSLYTEVACPRIWLPSASAGSVSGRSDALDSFFQRRLHRMRQQSWNCPT